MVPSSRPPKVSSDPYKESDPQFRARLVSSYLVLGSIEFLFVVGALSVGFYRIQSRVRHGDPLNLDVISEELLTSLSVAFISGFFLSVWGALYVSRKITAPLAKIKSSLKRHLRGETVGFDCSLREDDYFSELVPLLKCITEQKIELKKTSEKKSA